MDGLFFFLSSLFSSSDKVSTPDIDGLAFSFLSLKNSLSTDIFSFFSSSAVILLSRDPLTGLTQLFRFSSLYSLPLTSLVSLRCFLIFLRFSSLHLIAQARHGNIKRLNIYSSPFFVDLFQYSSIS